MLKAQGRLAENTMARSDFFFKLVRLVGPSKCETAKKMAF